MFLIVGIGNPGKKYESTRHNVGFRILDEIAANFSSASWRTIFNTKISKGEIRDKKVILAKPQTFMNESGRAVKKLATSYKLEITRIWVIHDDIDILLGKIKISVGKSSAGHKGIQSIINELQTKNFIRFRIGIKPQKTESKEQRIETEKFVLKKFTKEETKIVKDVIKKTVGAVEFALKNGIEKAMTKYNAY